MIVKKAVNMARMMNIPVLGVVENMSYVECPDCGKQIKIVGDSHIEETAAEMGLAVLAKLPIDPNVAAACDAGKVETVDTSRIAFAADAAEATPVIAVKKKKS